MGKDFYENWGSLRKITTKFHVVESHDYMIHIQIKCVARTKE